MSYASLSPARHALYRQTPTVGLGNPVAIAGTAFALLASWLIITAAEKINPVIQDMIRDGNLKYGEYYCDPETYDAMRCQEHKAFKRGAQSLLAGGELNASNFRAAAAAWSELGIQMPTLPSFLDDSFSISASDLSAALAVAGEDHPEGMEAMNAVFALAAPDVPPPAAIDPATVTVDPTTGAIEVSSGPTPTQIAVGALVVLGLGYAAYKYL